MLSHPALFLLLFLLLSLCFLLCFALSFPHLCLFALELSLLRLNFNLSIKLQHDRNSQIVAILVINFAKDFRNIIPLLSFDFQISQLAGIPAMMPEILVFLHPGHLKEHIIRLTNISIVQYD